MVHLWRDATFDQYVSRRLAVESGAWKASDGSAEPRITFHATECGRYREGLRDGFERTRARFGGSERYLEIEYRQLSDHAFVEEALERWFGQRVSVEETLRRQRGRPKIDYLTNPRDAEAYVDDSLSRGYADY